MSPPGPQQGPDNVPTLTMEQRQGCTTCGQIQRDIDTLKTSIQTERQQQQQQTLQQQESQIESYQQQESGQQPQQAPLDRQIQDKIALLEQLNEELAQAQAGQGGGIPPPPPSPPGVTFRGQLATNFEDFLKAVGEQATCASVLAKFGVPFPAAYAICAGVQTLVGDTKALEDYARKVYDYLTGSHQGGVPTVTTPPAPPPPDHIVRVCMMCDSTEDAIRWQAGESTAGCHIEKVEQLSIPQ